MSHGLKKLIVFLLSVCMPLQVLAQTSTGNELPDIGSPASSTLSIDDEFHIGL